MRTLKELAQEALAIQDASNINPVAHCFSRAMTELTELGLHTDVRKRD